MLLKEDQHLPLMPSGSADANSPLVAAFGASALDVTMQQQQQQTAVSSGQQGYEPKVRTGDVRGRESFSSSKYENVSQLPASLRML